MSISIFASADFAASFGSSSGIGISSSGIPAGAATPAFLRFVGALANGGRGPEPYLVEQVRVGASQTYDAKFKLGQQIRIQVVSVDRFMKTIDFLPVKNF